MRGWTVLKKLSRNEWAAVIYRVVQAATLLASFRIITIEYGTHVYGYVSLFMTFAAYLIFFDFGVVSFMRTEIPHAYALHGDRHANAVAIEGLKGLLIYAGGSYAVVLGVIWSSNHFLGWLQGLIKLSGIISIETIRDSIIVLLVYAAVMVLGNLVLAVLSARGKQYRYFYVMIVGSVFQINFIAISAKLEVPVNAIFATLLLSGVLPLLWLIFIELNRILKNYDPTVKVCTFNGTSTSFFVMQVGGLITNNLDVLIVAHFYSMQAVAVYSTMKIIIQLPISLHGSYMMQTWPIFSLMRAEGRFADIRTLLKTRLRYTLIFSGVIGTILILLAPEAMHLWSSGKLEVSRGEAFIFAALLVLYTYSACYSILIFSFNYIRPLANMVIAVVPVLYGVSILGKSLGFGIASVVMANMVVQTFGLIIGVYFYKKNLVASNREILP
jgi:O-antigen/teichoic acid export membrane protein